MTNYNTELDHLLSLTGFELAQLDLVFEDIHKRESSTDNTADVTELLNIRSQAIALAHRRDNAHTVGNEMRNLGFNESSTVEHITEPKAGNYGFVTPPQQQEVDLTDWNNIIM